MPAERHTTTGNRNPHVVAPGYRRESDRSAAWHRPGVWERLRDMRPAGEPSLLAGTAILIAFAGLGWLGWSLLP